MLTRYGIKLWVSLGNMVVLGLVVEDMLVEPGDVVVTTVV